MTLVPEGQVLQNILRQRGVEAGQGYIASYSGLAAIILLGLITCK